VNPMLNAASIIRKINPRPYFPALLTFISFILKIAYGPRYKCSLESINRGDKLFFSLVRKPRTGDLNQRLSPKPSTGYLVRLKKSAVTLSSCLQHQIQHLQSNSRGVVIEIIVICTVLCGCIASSANGPIFEPAPTKNEQKGILYFYRTFADHFNGGSVAPVVTVNHKTLVLLRNNGYTWLVLDPGKYVIETKHNGSWHAGDEDRLELSIQRGDKYFIRILPEFHFIGTTDFTLTMMPETSALMEIKETRYLEPENIE